MTAWIRVIQENEVEGELTDRHEEIVELEPF